MADVLGTPNLLGTHRVQADSNRMPFYLQKDLSLDYKFCGLPSYDIQDRGNFTFLHFPALI